MVTIIIISWLVLCIVVGYVAEGQGRGFFTYFTISLVLLPLVGFLILAIKGKATQEETIRQTMHIFYCPNCKSTYSSYGGKTETCPNCTHTLMETTISAEEWRNYDSTKKESMKQAFSEGQFSINSLETPAQMGTVQQNNPADEIKKYKELLDIGAITQEEYDVKKKQLLGL